MSSQEAKKWKVGKWVRVIQDLTVWMEGHPVTGYIPKDSIGRIVEVVKTRELIVLLFFCPNQDENGNWDQHVETVNVYFNDSRRVLGGNRTSQLKRIAKGKKKNLPPTTMTYSR